MESNEDNGISDQVLLIYNACVYGVVCQIINIFGIATNIINIICFVKQGFEDSVNVSLLGLAVSDLASLITMVWSCICLTPAFMAVDLPFDPFDVAYITSAMAHMSFTRISGCITAFITLERCLCVTAPLKIKGIITPKRACVVNICVFIIFFSTSTPVYVVNRLDVIFSLARNKTLVGLISTKDKEHVEMISFTINNFFIPFATFVIIAVCSAVLSFKLRASSQWRKKAITITDSERISNRNQKTAQMVVIIATLFIVCFLPVACVMMALAFVPEMRIGGKYVNLGLIVAGFGYIMETINSSMNIFIYSHMSSKYRGSITKMFTKLRFIAH